MFLFLKNPCSLLQTREKSAGGPWPWGRPRRVCFACGQLGPPGSSRLLVRGTHQSQRGKADSVLGLLLVLTMEVPLKCLGDPKGARTTLQELPVQHRGELPAVVSGVVCRLRVLDTVFDPDASTPVTAWLLAGGRAPAARTLQQGVGAPLWGRALRVDGRVRSASFCPYENNAEMQGPCPYIILQVRGGGIPRNRTVVALGTTKPPSARRAGGGQLGSPARTCTPSPCQSAGGWFLSMAFIPWK